VNRSILLLICYCVVVLADVLPFGGSHRPKEDRSQDSYAWVDSFCKGKKIQAECTISGPIPSGGGKGVCEVNNKTAKLTCVRSAEPIIDRQLPDGGYVADSTFCKDGLNILNSPIGRSKNCKPLKITPVDRFCKGKTVGRPCAIEFTYNGKQMSSEGVCKQVVEMSEPYNFFGERRDQRVVIKCESKPLPERTMTPVDWLEKLRQ
jgi:hypothetical protein